MLCVDKANVLESSRLWRETVQAMEKDYPEVEVSYELVDAVAKVLGAMGPIVMMCFDHRKSLWRYSN